MTDKLESLKPYYDAVAACNRCGFCTSYCPTYNATGIEALSPRGRNQMFRALIEGSLADPAAAARSIETCVLCGECTSVCFSEVPVADLMIQARHALNELRGIPLPLKFILRRILPFPRRYAFILRLSFIGKRLGVSALLRGLGVLDAVAPALAAADRLLSRAPGRFLKDRRDVRPYTDAGFKDKKHDVLRAQKKINDLKKKGAAIPRDLAARAIAYPERPKTALLTACGSQYLRPATGGATAALLRMLNIDFIVPDLLCCGLPAASYGVLEQVRHHAKENIKVIESGRYDTLVLDDSSCAAHFKGYGAYFPGDAEWRDRARAVEAKMNDASEFFVARGLADALGKSRWSGKVAFHDPCKAQYGQKIIAAPRALLSAIPRLELVDVAEADQCCGGGGTFSLAHPDLSQGMLARKIDNLAAAGASTIVTSSESCRLQLEFGARTKKLKVRVVHLNEFLVEALRSVSMEKSSRG